MGVVGNGCSMIAPLDFIEAPGALSGSRRHANSFVGHDLLHAGADCPARHRRLGLFLIVHASILFAYYAVWMVLRVAMAANLYDAASAMLGPEPWDTTADYR